MPFQREKEIESILYGLIPDNNSNDAKRIFSVTGLFGIGKTWLIDEIQNEIVTKKLADAVLRFQPNEEVGFITDLTLNLLSSARMIGIENPATLFPDDSRQNHNHFLELLTSLKENDTELFEKYIYNAFLKNLVDIIISSSIGQNRALDDNTVDAVEKLFEKRSDNRLLLDNFEIAAESFIVDIMHYFIPMSEDGEFYRNYIEHNNPKKIVVIIDDYELIAGSVNEWLKEFLLPLTCYKNFTDFKNYDTSFLGDELRVSHFLDIRFILGSREEFINNQEMAAFPDMTDRVLNIELKCFDNDQISEYLYHRNTNMNLSTEKIHSITFGIPYMLNLLVKAFNVGINDSDIAEIYSSASSRLLNNKIEHQKQWVICAAFLEEFDSDGLRCFKQTNNIFNSVFHYFKNSSELTESSGNKVKIKPLIAKIIQHALKNKSPKTAMEYFEIVNTYRESKEKLNDLDFKESEIVRNLAYFKRFDKNYVIEQVFQDSISAMNKIIDKKNSWFQENQYTWSLKEPVASWMKQYNRLVDNDRFDEKFDMVKDVWADYASSIADENKKIIEHKTALDSERNELIEDVKDRKKKYGNIQAKFIDTENQLIDYRKHISNLASNRNITTAVFNFSAGVIAIFLGYLFPVIFGGNSSLLLIDIAQYILFASAAVFIAIGVVFLKKVIFVKKLKQEIDEFEDKIKKLEENKEKNQQDMKKIRDEWEVFERKAKELAESMAQLDDAIQRNNNRLEESFI